MSREEMEIGRVRGVGTAALREAERREREVLEEEALLEKAGKGKAKRSRKKGEADDAVKGEETANAASSTKAGNAAKAASSSSGKKRGGSSRGKRNKELGRRGEEAAAVYLERRGYDILERNWTCVAGEADLVVTDGDYLVFVEVKTRTDTEKGFPAEAVTAKKREKYERIAAVFLQNHRISDIGVRFDVVSIIAYGADRAFIKHHINAFA